MKKLLILLLIALIFGSISALSIKEEWEKVKDKCSEVKAFLRKYDIYDNIVDLLKKGAKAAAQKYCEKKLSSLYLSSEICTSIVTVVGKLTSNIHIC